MKKRITRIANKERGLAVAGVLVVLLLIMGLVVTVTSGKNNSKSENLTGTEEQESEDLEGTENQEPEGLAGIENQENDSTEQITPAETIEVLSEIARKENDRFGWSITKDNKLLHQNADTGNMEQVVDLTHFASEEEFVDCSFVNENTAYIAYFSQEKQLVELQYTTDGAKTWKKCYIPGQPELGVGGIFLSVVDETTGYLLVGSEPGAGMMKKTLYVTKDGGKSLEKVEEPDMRNHPSDLLFITEEIGFMATKYYGEDPYLYLTKDGGKNWNPVNIELPDGGEFSYVNGYSLEMKDNPSNEILLVLEGVGINENSYLDYVSKDAGKNWEFVVCSVVDNLTQKKIKQMIIF